MSGFDARKKMRESFENALMRRYAKANLSPGQWQVFRRIEDQHTRDHRKLVEKQRTEYKSRVETRLRAMIHDAGALKKTLEMTGNDKFDKAGLFAQARRYVRLEQQQERLKLRDTATGAKEKLLDKQGKLDGYRTLYNERARRFSFLKSEFMRGTERTRERD